jgi:hypothetical protein
MAITEGGSPKGIGSSTSYLAPKEAQSTEATNLNTSALTQKQSDAIARLRALGSELRRFISAGKRGHKDEHNSIGL